MSDSDIARQLPDWEHRDGGIHRHVEVDDYGAAMALTVRIGLEAQRRNHHPDITVGWGRVDVSLTTHDAGGSVTDKDIDLARWIDEVVNDVD